MTNEHVIYDVTSNSFPNFCQIYFPNDPNITTIPYDTNHYFEDPNGEDSALITIDNPDAYISSTASTGLRLNSCSSKYPQDIVEGNEIIFLGYPAIGSPTSQLSIKATQGIISGFDGDYYLTDAKIEEGNSGGAAILQKDDCFLGTTTYKIYGPTNEYYSGVLSAAAIFRR